MAAIRLQTPWGLEPLACCSSYGVHSTALHVVLHSLKGVPDPQVPPQCPSCDGAAAALNGTQQGAGGHSRRKGCGPEGLKAALGPVHPVLPTLCPTVEPWPTQEHAQPIWLQQHGGEKTCAVAEPVIKVGFG